MIIKLFQEGLRELLREASRTALRSYPNTSFSFAKVIEAKASWFHDFQEGLRELLREATRSGQTFQFSLLSSHICAMRSIPEATRKLRKLFFAMYCNLDNGI